MKAWALSKHVGERETATEMGRMDCSRGEDSNQILVVGVTNLLNEVGEMFWKLCPHEVTVRGREGVRELCGRQTDGVKRGNLRFSRLGDAENVRDSEPLQDLEFPRGLERTDVQT